MDRNLQLLGLAKKAGLLAIGCDASAAAARKGQTKLIITASDASERTHRNARINADACGAICLTVPYTMFELGNMTGQGSPGTVAFLDTGFSVRFLQGLAETEHGLYEKVWDFLEQSSNGYAKKENTGPHGKRRTTK